MSSIDDTINHLESLLNRNDPAPSITETVTFTRGDLLFTVDGVRVFNVEADGTSGRGVIWVEDDRNGVMHHEVMQANQFSTRHPSAERRQNRIASQLIATIHPVRDRRAA